MLNFTQGSVKRKVILFCCPSTHECSEFYSQACKVPQIDGNQIKNSCLRFSFSDLAQLQIIRLLVQRVCRLQLSLFPTSLFRMATSSVSLSPSCVRPRCMVNTNQHGKWWVPHSPSPTSYVLCWVLFCMLFIVAYGRGTNFCICWFAFQAT